MLKRSNLELNFISGRDPLPTVEVQTDSLAAHGLYFGQIVSSALARYAAKNPTSTATIYTYGTMSINFHDAGWSEFLIVAGDKKVLEVLHGAFSSLSRIKSRYSDYVAPSQGTRAFHIQDGRLWEPEDAVTWYSASPQEAANDQQSADKAAMSDADVEDDDDAWDDVIEDSVLELEQNENKTDTPGRALEKPGRYRAARSDATVASIRQTVEQLFGLPEGSVALCGPDGRALKGNAFIKTLRKRWEEA